MAASAALRQAILDTAPRRPWCAVEKDGARVRPLATALERPFIQLNQPSMWHWLQFDLDDDPGGGRCIHAWEDHNLPPPSYVAINRENAHAQYGYLLAAPVCTSPAGHMKPRLYLAAIQHAYGEILRADRWFRGPLAKNPLSSKWLLWEPAANAPRYELGALAEHVTLPDPAVLLSRPINSLYGALGKNCKLFEEVRVMAYPLVREYWRPGGFDAFTDRILQEATAHASCTAPQLPYSEVCSIARSVSRWVWKKLTPAGFREVQAARGRRHGASRRKILLPTARQLACQGRSVRAIAAEIGVPRATVTRWLARDDDGQE